MCGRYVTPDEAAMERARLRFPVEHAFASTRASTLRSRVPRGTGDARGRAMGAATCKDSNRYRVFVNAEGRVMVQKLD